MRIEIYFEHRHGIQIRANGLDSGFKIQDLKFFCGNLRDQREIF